MTIEQNKNVIRRVVEEVFNKGDMSIAPEFIASNYVYHSPYGEFKGPEGFIQFVGMTLNAFSDFHMTIDDMIGEGEKLAALVSWTGTFMGKFGDMEPTGKQVSMTAAYFYRFENGKEVDVLPFTDTLSLYQQLGVSPPTG